MKLKLIFKMKVILSKDNEISVKVEEAINFLKPYFGLDNIDRFPEISIRNDLHGARYINDFRMEFSMNCSESLLDRTIFHETGHFLHHYINPDIWGIHSIYSHNLIEAIGHFSEALFLTGGRFNEDGRFNLYFLVRMNHEDAKKYNRIDELYNILKGVLDI